MFCDSSGLDAVSGPCKQGFYCVMNATTSEPKDGKSGDVCPMGHYCTQQTSEPYKCPNATYMNHTGILWEICSTQSHRT